MNSDNKLNWQLSYENLGKPELVVADIHSGPPRSSGPCVSSVHLLQAGASGVLQAQAGRSRTSWSSGEQWVTLITEKYPNGAIRGQIAVK